MARIPTIEAQGFGVPTSQPTSLLSGGSTGQGSIGAAPRLNPVIDRGPTVDASFLGRAISNVAEKLAKKQKAENTLWVEEQTSNSERHWLRWMHEKQKNPTPGTNEEFTTEYAKFTEDLLETAPDDKLRKRLHLNLNRLNTKLTGQSLVLSARAAAQATVSRLNNMVLNASDMIASSNSPGVMEEQQATLFAVVAESQEGNKITKDTAESFNQSIRNLSLDTAEHLSAINPDAAEEVLDNAEGVDLRRRTAIENKIRSARNTHDSLFAAEQQQLLQANLEQIEQTGVENPMFNPDIYKLATNEGAALKATNAISVAKDFFSAKSSMQDKNKQELSTLLAAAQPKENDPLFNQKQQVFQELAQYAGEQVRMIDADPFAYSLQDPVINESLVKFSEAADENKAAFRSNMIEASLAYQRDTLKIPEGARSVMTKDQAVRAASLINSAEPAVVENEFISLMQSYGSFYPEAFRDMSRLPESERIDTSLQIMALHIGKPWLNDFITASRTPEKDFNLESSVVKEISEGLFGNGDLNSFKAAITASNPELISYADDFTDATRKYAMQLVARGTEGSSRKAVKSAVERIINSEYAFGSSNSEIYAIRRKYTTRDGVSSEFTNKEIKTIERSLNDPTRWLDIKPEDLNQAMFNFPPTISEETKLEAMKDTINTHAFWVTSPDNMGVTMYLPGVDGTAAPLTDNNGSEIIINFTDALKRHTQKVEETRQFKSKAQAESFEAHPQSQSSRFLRAYGLR